jgi:hypothetical protein
VEDHAVSGWMSYFSTLKMEVALPLKHQYWSSRINGTTDHKSSRRLLWEQPHVPQDCSQFSKRRTDTFVLVVLDGQ